MRLRSWLLAVSILTIAAPLRLAGPTAAVAAGVAEGHDCTGSPDDAVTKLPLPLSKWAQVACTPIGHILMSREGWVWLMPDASGTVFVPSQIVDKAPAELGNKSYFTKIEVHSVKGKEFDEAYGSFHVGFDEKEVKPDAYQVDLATAAGETLRMYFFDYDTYAWGMTCPEDKCDLDSRFMVLDKNHRPEPRQPAI